jgi:hypothetical protein
MKLEQIVKMSSVAAFYYVLLDPITPPTHFYAALNRVMEYPYTSGMALEKWPMERLNKNVKKGLLDSICKNESAPYNCFKNCPSERLTSQEEKRLVNKISKSSYSSFRVLTNFPSERLTEKQKNIFANGITQHNSYSLFDALINVPFENLTPYSFKLFVDGTTSIGQTKNFPKLKTKELPRDRRRCFRIVKGRDSLFPQQACAELFDISDVEYNLVSEILFERIRKSSKYVDLALKNLSKEKRKDFHLFLAKNSSKKAAVAYWSIQVNDEPTQKDFDKAFLDVAKDKNYSFFALENWPKERFSEKQYEALAKKVATDDFWPKKIRDEWDEKDKIAFDIVVYKKVPKAKKAYDVATKLIGGAYECSKNVLFKSISQDSKYTQRALDEFPEDKRQEFDNYLKILSEKGGGLSLSEDQGGEVSLYEGNDGGLSLTENEANDETIPEKEQYGLIKRIFGAFVEF